MPSDTESPAHSPPAPESPPLENPAVAPTRGRAVSTALAWLVVAAITYVLSPLPMGVTLDLLPYRASLALEPKVKAFYAPLVWAYDRNDNVREFYDWYEHILDT